MKRIERTRMRMKKLPKVLRGHLLSEEDRKRVAEHLASVPYDPEPVKTAIRELYENSPRGRMPASWKTDG